MQPQTMRRAIMCALVLGFASGTPAFAQTPMDRMGSGTSWMPEAAPLPSIHWAAGGWMLMLHGFAFAQLDAQGGPRGSTQAGSLNWAMLMASHGLAGGQLQLRGELSLDAATVSPRGYPLLLQTGESYGGQPLHDRQHPHDFFMEVAALYEHPLGGGLSLSIYGGPSGEPALGPVAYMHRSSAMDDPVAPLSHHRQDATHVSFGVATAGLAGRTWKMEASAFNGRDPDEHRWGFDRLHLDSYSGRLTVAPDEHWSFSAGYGSLDSSTHRATASAMFGRDLRGDGRLAASLIWGANFHAGQTSAGVLLEAEAILDARLTILGRVETVTKSGAELVLPVVNPSQLFRVWSVSLGGVREIARTSGATFGLGLRGAINVVPRALEPFYGSRTPPGAFVFLRVRPRPRPTQSMPMNMDHNMRSH